MSGYKRGEIENRRSQKIRGTPHMEIVEERILAALKIRLI
jgi:hypothetical protein